MAEEGQPKNQEQLVNEILKQSNIPGRRKAAVLMITLGADLASKVYKLLDDRLIEKLTLEISNISNIKPEQKIEVLKDFQKSVIEEGLAGTGGVSSIREVLEKAVGPHRASDIIS